MPPWLPAPESPAFIGERRLDAAEIDILTAWSAAGAPEGDPADLAPPPDVDSPWALGEPDLVLEAPAYRVPATGRDIYRNLVVPVPGGSIRYVRAVDLQPGTPGVVHHARMMLDTTSSSRDLASAEPDPGFDGMAMISAAGNPSGHFVGWTPGRTPHPGYPDLAWAMAPGDDLVLQLHLRPSGEEETVRPRIGLYLADEPPARVSSLVLLGTEVIDIPAGDSTYAVTDSFELPVGVELLSVYPHAHYLGRTMDGIARLPDGRARTVIRIDDWDFDWQDEYRLARPLRLPAGTVLSMRFTYDNSASNPQNPSDPPRRVTYGSLSTDEMADLILQVVPEDSSDAGTLERALAWKYERAAQDYFAWKELDLGRQAAEAGDLQAALEHYRASLRSRDDPRALIAMADVALQLGDRELAVLVLGRAEVLARRAGDEALADSLRDRVARLGGGGH